MIVKFLSGFILCLVACSSLCQGQSVRCQSVTTIITKLGKKDFFHFFFQDHYTDFKNFRISDKPGEGLFKTDLSLATPLLARFEDTDGLFRFLWLEPGDTVLVKKNASGHFYAFSQNKDFSAQIALWQAYSDSFNVGTNGDMQYSPGMNINYFTTQSAGFLDRKYRLIAQYDAVYHFSPIFKEKTRALFLYQYIGQLIMPYYTDSAWRKLPEAYVSNLRGYIGNFNNDSVINFSSYLLTAWNFNKFLTKTTIDDSAQPDAQYKTALRYFKGKTRDFILLKILHEIMVMDVRLFESKLAEFKRDCKTDIYLAYADSLQRSVNDFSRNDDLLATVITKEDNTISTFEEILSENKGKVLYIDFWASWCAPCRAEMPNSILLKEKFTGQPVSFVYISIDNDKQAWKNSITQLFGQTRTAQYLIDGIFNSRLATLIGLKAIPLYMIIDGEGKLVSMNATRPGNPATVEIIRNLLKEAYIN